MTRKEALAELIEKVEAGKPAKVRIWFGAVGVCYHIASNAAAGSLDSAKALHEAELPGWPYTIENVTGETYRAWTDKSRNLRRPGFSHRGPCPARTWLLAILHALHAKEKNDE